MTRVQRILEGLNFLIFLILICWAGWAVWGTYKLAHPHEPLPPSQTVNSNWPGAVFVYGAHDFSVSDNTNTTATNLIIHQGVIEHTEVNRNMTLIGGLLVMKRPSYPDISMLSTNGEIWVFADITNRIAVIPKPKPDGTVEQLTQENAALRKKNKELISRLYKSADLLEELARRLPTEPTAPTP